MIKVLFTPVEINIDKKKRDMSVDDVKPPVTPCHCEYNGGTGSRNSSRSAMFQSMNPS